ncbi:MAG: hypothetical protein NVS3B24_17840 [Candidatus Dormibacteria bacterium]
MDKHEVVIAGAGAVSAGGEDDAARRRARHGTLILYAVLYMASTRTQVYLTAEQRARIDRLIAREGHSLAWVVREALDQYLAGPAPDRARVLDSTFGALPDLTVPHRDEWERYPAGRQALELPGAAPRRRRTAPRRPA